MKRMLVASLALTSVLALGCAGREINAEEMRFAAARTVEVPRNVVTTGKIAPEVGSEVKIGPRISGRLIRLHVRVGEYVHRGAMIAELDDAALRLQVQRAGAELESARADEAYAQAAFDRKKNLADRGLASQDDLAVAERDLRRSRARARSVAADYEAARVELGYARLYSPIAGVVASVSTQEGETVAASFAAPTFVTIVDPSKLKLLAYIDEFDVALIKADQQVTFTADALPSETFAGVIRAVNPQAVIRDNVTNYVANVELVAGSTDRLRPDMSVDVVIETGLRSRFLIIPESAVVREGEKTYVYVRQATRLEKRRVQLGDAAGEGLRVREGITDGEMVVLNPDVVTQ